MDANGDQLLVAINHAKDFAQREVDFERAFVQVRCIMPEATQGGSLLTTTDLVTNEVVEVKTIRKAFLRNTDGLERPVGVISRQAYVDALGRRFSSLGSSPSSSDISYALACPETTVVLQGDRFFVYPLNTLSLGSLTQVPVYFDAIHWLPDFAEDKEPSFLFIYCNDFMMFRSIFELNFLLKEDQRFNVSMTVLESTWQSVKNWNSKYIGNAVDNVSLD